MVNTTKVEVTRQDAKAWPIADRFGSGFIIGDGYILTAAHLIYEYDGKKPADVVSHLPSSDVTDLRGYRNSYLAAAQQQANPVADAIEAGLISQDIALIKDSSAKVSANDAGIATYINFSDLTSTNFGLSNNTTLKRYGKVSTSGSGQIVNLASGGFWFDRTSDFGDSGGPYILATQLAGRSFEFAIAIQSAKRNIPNGDSFATAITRQEWQQINDIIGGGKSGNVTLLKPANLVVGSAAADGTLAAPIFGSFRADIILGNGGNDVLIGDPFLSGAWGDDLIFGGDGDDTLSGGNSLSGNKGFDLLHGGTYSTERKADGVDNVSYEEVLTGIRIDIGGLPQDKRYDAESNFTSAIFVTFRSANPPVNTLISIEKIMASNVDDKLSIHELSATHLAKADADPKARQGGLASIDLGAQITSGELGGDLIELTRLAFGAKIVIADEQATTKMTLSALATPDLTLDVIGGERLIASDHDDEIVSTATAGVIVNGAGGNDSILGGAGNDIARGGLGEDILRGGDGNDVLHGGDGSDMLFGDAGDDDLYTGAGVGQAFGGAGSDLIVLGSTPAIPGSGSGGGGTNYGAPVQVSGGDGHDKIVLAMDEAAIVSGGTGNDILDVQTDGGTFAYVFAAGDGRDVIIMPDVGVRSGAVGSDLVIHLHGIAASQLSFRWNIREVNETDYFTDMDDGTATGWWAMGDLAISIAGNADTILVRNVSGMVVYPEQGNGQQPQIWPGMNAAGSVAVSIGLTMMTGPDEYVFLSNFFGLNNGQIEYSLGAIDAGFYRAETDFAVARPTPPDFIV